jgi:hypothetical protein
LFYFILDCEKRPGEEYKRVGSRNIFFDNKLVFVIGMISNFDIKKFMLKKKQLD